MFYKEEARIQTAPNMPNYPFLSSLYGNQLNQAAYVALEVLGTGDSFVSLNNSDVTKQGDWMRCNAGFSCCPPQGAARDEREFDQLWCRSDSDQQEVLPEIRGWNSVQPYQHESETEKVFFCLLNKQITYLFNIIITL